MVAGTAWPVNLSFSEIDAPVDAAEPTEGMTGWADTWMLAKDAPHPNCMLEWMKWTMTADVQAEVADYYGAGTSNAAACDVLRKRLDKATGRVRLTLVDTVRYGHCGRRRVPGFAGAVEDPRPSAATTGCRVPGLLGLAAEVDGDPRSLTRRTRMGARPRGRRILLAPMTDVDDRTGTARGHPAQPRCSVTPDGSWVSP